MNFYIPYQSPNIRYNFKVTHDQFGNRVPNHFHDELEIVAIRDFEKYMLQMIKSDPSKSYTMIELGSNQAYYSLMFHSILKKLGSNPINILVEAQEENLLRGVNHFKLNGFNAESRLYSIGTLEKVIEALKTRWPDDAAERCANFNPNWRTLSNIFEEFGLEELDVLHCDIDFCENVLFETSEDLFKQKKIKYIFLSTHGHFHEISLHFLKACGYEILLNHDSRFPPVGYDTLIIARA
jgi:hypothetical protein